MKSLIPWLKQAFNYASNGPRCFSTELSSYTDRRKTPPKNIFLFTFARGGSTALAETISNSIHCPIVWEPFFKGRRPFPKFDHETRWGWTELLSRELNDSSIDDYMNALYWREFLSPRFFTGQSVTGLTSRDPLVYKFCHANGMAPYITKKWKAPVVLFHRHPAQIILSRYRYGFFKGKTWIDADQFSDDVSHQKAPSELRGLYKDDRKDFILTKAGVMAWQYALERKSWEIVQQSEGENVLWLDYDDFVLQPEVVMRRLENFLNIPLQQSKTTKPSRVSIDVPPQNKTDLMKWKQVIPTEIISEIRGICDLFGFSDLEW